jgi:hypothetical protein
MYRSTFAHLHTEYAPPVARRRDAGAGAPALTARRRRALVPRLRPRARVSHA